MLNAKPTGALGYGKAEWGRAKESRNSKGGYYQEDIHGLRRPRDRNGEFSTALPKPRQWWTGGICQTVAKLYSAGMTDSEISEFVAFLCKGAYPASMVSAFTGCLKEDIEAFGSPPIDAG